MTVLEWIATLPAGDQVISKRLMYDGDLDGSETFVAGDVSGKTAWLRAQPAAVLPPPVEISNKNCDLLPDKT